jgi:hypothetical protein
LKPSLRCDGAHLGQCAATHRSHHQEQVVDQSWRLPIWLSSSALPWPAVAADRNIAQRR